MVLEFLDSFAAAEAVEADEEEAQRIQSNADGRRENMLLGRSGENTDC